MNQTSMPVTFITGTRKGLGRALVEHYVRLGHAVAGCSREPIDWQLDGYVTTLPMLLTNRPFMPRLPMSGFDTAAWII